LTAHVCGAGMAFLGFSLSLIIGLWVNNPFTTVVSRSLVVLFFSYIFGLMLAGIGQKVIVENFEAERDMLAAQSEQQSDRQPESEYDEQQDASVESLVSSTAEATPAEGVSAA
jgi:hypothetical protein